MEKKQKAKPIVLISIICVAVIGVLVACYFFVLPIFNLGPKNITIRVTASNGVSTDYQLRTSSKYLIQAMNELSSKNSSFSFVQKDSDNGIVIETINNERASFTDDNAYWAIYVNGEFGKNDATTQPLKHGDVYEWRYEVLY